MANKEKVCVDKLLRLFTRSILCQILCNLMDFSTPGFPVLPSQSLSKLMSIESMMPSKHLILCCPLPLSSIFPSIRVFSNELALCIRCPEYWSFSIIPSNGHSGLISFRIDQFDLSAVQGTLKSLQCHSSKASILQHSTFFIVQFLYPYLTGGKTIALTRQTFVGKVMSLLFNTLSCYINIYNKVEIPYQLEAFLFIRNHLLKTKNTFQVIHFIVFHFIFNLVFFLFYHRIQS